LKNVRFIVAPQIFRTLKTADLLTISIYSNREDFG